jgi:hypothetical protein
MSQYRRIESSRALLNKNVDAGRGFFERVALVLGADDFGHLLLAY